MDWQSKVVFTKVWTFLKDLILACGIALVHTKETGGVKFL